MFRRATTFVESLEEPENKHGRDSCIVNMLSAFKLLCIMLQLLHLYCDTYIFDCFRCLRD
jgi:hypothetical protein